MSKIIYLLFVIFCGCAEKTTIIGSKISNKKGNLVADKIENKQENKLLKYDIENNIYTLKLENTEPFTFSLKKSNNLKLYEKIEKQNTSIIEASKTPLVNTTDNKINIESYILNGVGDKKNKIINLKIAVNEVLDQKENINLGNGGIKTAFEKSFGNYFFDIENGNLTNLTQNKNKLQLLNFLKNELSNLNSNSTDTDIDNFLNSLHIKKTETNKDIVFINGKTLNNFNYFDFGIWEQDISIKYEGNNVLKKCFNLKDENKHNFIPFISANKENKIQVEQNTPMKFSGFVFAGVKNNEKYKIFNGSAIFEIYNNNKGNIFFDFTDWEKFSFSDIFIDKDSFKGKYLTIKEKDHNEFTIPNINELKTIQLNGNFYGKNKVTESAGTFKIESKDSNYQVDGVFGVKKN